MVLFVGLFGGSKVVRFEDFIQDIDTLSFQKRPKRCLGNMGKFWQVWVHHVLLDNGEKQMVHSSDVSANMTSFF